MQEQNLNRISPPRAAIFLAIAALGVLALPGWADSLGPATITTSLDQCASQSGGPCGVLPALASYNGSLSGFSTETVGAGANLTASGFSSPTLTASVPLSSANAIVNGELEYLFEVVGAAGPVSLGVNSMGSISVSTVGNTLSFPGNDASMFTLINFQIESDASGTVIFSDEANIQYSANASMSGCVSSNSSTQSGVATLSTTIACGSSTASGGFDDTGSYTIQANAVYLVILQADLNLGTNNGSGLSAAGLTGTVQGTASVDPILTVPNGYTLDLSSGVGNSAPTVASTPEPSAWVLLATALGIGGIARRRQLNRASRSGAPVQ